jgi:glycerol-3-phosphate O-acyltransferase/dihydroxyacetone phosphate acyltransferase
VHAPAPDPPDAFYAGARLLGRFWLWFLLRDVAVRHAERVPPAGPVLLCVNHPNNLLDSLLVGAVLPRQVHYLGHASLFRSRLVARFLTRAGVIPVHRREDAPADADRNAAAFAACRQALAEGRVLAIYPEGTTHAEARVQRLRTGAARIALDYEAARAGAPGLTPRLAVVAVGLSFAARKSFRGRVLVAFGPPLALEAHVARYSVEPAAAVATLTAAIQAAMEAEVVHVDRIAAADLVGAVERLYRDELVRQLRHERGLPPEAIDTFRLDRTIADAVGWFKARDPERVEQLWHRIRGYQVRLAAYRVQDRAVSARAAPATAAPGAPRRLGRRSALAVLGFPVFVYGAAVNALPYFVPRSLARRLARKETDYATIRLLASTVAFPLFWGLETWLVWRTLGPVWALGFATALPLTGLAAYHYLAGLGRLRARVGFATLALTHRQAAARLLAERRLILTELERAKAEYLAGRPAAEPVAVP